jgi:hypothetical protein
MPIDTTLKKETKAVVERSDNPGMVQVNRKTLDEMVKRIEQQSKDIDMLKTVADKARMSTYATKTADFSQKTVRLNMYNGQVVMAWRTVENEIYQDSQGRWHENQKMEIITEKNERIALPYIDFVHNLLHSDADVISNYTTPEGIEMCRVNIDNRMIDIDKRFLN